MLFYLLYCFVIVISASSEKDQISENAEVSDTSEGRIAGGEDASERVSIPFQAQISSLGASFCSGVLYNEHHILTAAHCVENTKPGELTVRVGSEVLGRGMVVPIAKIVRHPDYDTPQNNFDIAVLRTKIRLVFNRKMRSVVNVDYDDDNVGRELQVSGWGYQGDGRMQLSDDLRVVVLPIINAMECDVFYPTIGITKNMICGYSLRNLGSGACVGDGGAPAVIPNTRILLGISSFTVGCGPGMGPSVFTFVRAREIREFIVNNTIMEEESHEVIKIEEEEDNNDLYQETTLAPDGFEPDDSRVDHERPQSTVEYYGDDDHHQKSGHGQPGHGHPEHGQSGHGRPEHGHPGHGQSGHGRTEHGQPGHGQPGHGQAGHGQSGYGQSGNGRPDRGQSGHGQFEHGRPGHGQSGHRRPIKKSGHKQPGHGHPGHGRAGHGQHEHERPEHERPESSLELPEIPLKEPEHERSERPSQQAEDEQPEGPSEESGHEGSKRLSEQLEHDRLEMPSHLPQSLSAERPEKSTSQIQTLSMQPQRRPIERPQMHPAVGAI